MDSWFHSLAPISEVFFRITHSVRLCTRFELQLLSCPSHSDAPSCNKYTELQAHIWFWKSRLSSQFFFIYGHCIFGLRKLQDLPFSCAFLLLLANEANYASTEKQFIMGSALFLFLCDLRSLNIFPMEASISAGDICWILEFLYLKASQFWTKDLSPLFGSVITHPHDSEEGGTSFISGCVHFLFIDLVQVCLYWPTVTDAQLPIYDRGNTIVHALHRTAYKPFIKAFYLPQLYSTYEVVHSLLKALKCSR